MESLESIPRLRDLDLVGRRVFLRADLDGPRSPYGTVLDDLPLRVLLPTLRALVQQRAKVIVGASFLTDPESTTTSEGVAARLSELLGAKVGVLSKDFVRELRFVEEKQVVLTPNLAAYPEERANDPDWSAKLAASLDVYVLDGLRAAREHTASVVSIPRLLAARGAGPLVGSALDVHKDVVEAPAPPFTLVLGGHSVKRLSPLVLALLPSVQDIVLGGTVANTFFVAQGWQPGGSAYEADGVTEAQELLNAAQARNVSIHMPVDAVVRIKGPGRAPPTWEVRPIGIDIPYGPTEAAVDIAVQTCVEHRNVIARSTTALWVGLMGDCSVEETQSGSLRVGQSLTEAKRGIVAGEETVAWAAFFGLDGRLRVAPGGEAALALLSGDVLPGLDALGR